MLSVVTNGGRVVTSRQTDHTAFAFKDHRSHMDHLLATWNWGFVPSVYFPTFPSRNSHSVHINPPASTSI